jgi:hypothetical protein
MSDYGGWKSIYASNTPEMLLAGGAGRVQEGNRSADFSPQQHPNVPRLKKIPALSSFDVAAD